jgi:hypothetical protein
MAIVTLPVAEQPLSVTVTPNVTVPDGPAVNVIDAVVVDDVMVPPLIVHAYVADGDPAGTETTLPAEFGATAGGAVIVAAGGVQAVIATAADPVAVQLLSVTMTVRLTLPVAAAVNVMDAVFVADVIEPPLIDQEYVAPGEPDGTDAMLPLEFAATDEGAAMAVDGGVHGVIVIDFVPVAVQPLSVTVTERFTLPVAPALNAIDVVFVADVMVPPVMDHRYVAPPDPAVTEALFAVEFATIAADAVIAVEGGVHGVMLIEVLPVAVHPLSVTVAVRSTVPLGPAVKVIEGPFAAEVIEPPAIVQE